MGRKLRHVLIFLLIILKEPYMPEARCLCEPFSRVLCRKGLTSIPQNLPTSISSNLVLEKNHIKTVKQSDLLKYKNLSSLCLENNLITKIEAGTFANLPRLEHLKLGRNWISEIHPGSFANLPMLEKLYLDNNKITKIETGTFVSLPQLQRLVLGYNRITTIYSSTFANLPQLQKLYLEHNQITTKHSGTLIANLPQLKTLFLNKNKITTIHSGTFGNPPQLQELWLANNKITDIYSGTFANLNQLQYLYLQINQITVIHSGAFENLRKLKELWLANNQIATIHSGTFANLNQLQQLWLGYNRITIIHSGTFANLNQLQYLYLHNNRINTIQPGTFRNPSIFKRLNLQKNNMSAIPLPVFCLFQSTVEIRLKKNPWQCDCRMIPVRPISAFSDQIICAQPPKVQGQELVHVDPKELTCEEPTISPLSVDSCSAAVSTPSVGNTENNASPSVFKLTADSTAHSTENKSKTRATLTSPLAVILDKRESAPSSPQPAKSTRITDIHVISQDSNHHRYFKFNAVPQSDLAGKTILTPPLAITPDKPKSAPSPPLLVLIRSLCGTVAGTVFIATFLAVIWYKKRTRNPPLGRNPGPGVVGSNRNTAVSVMASGDDHQYEDIDHDQTGQGQSQTNANRATVITSGHDQTGQGQLQSQAITRSLDVSNLSYGTDLTASQQSALYKDVTQCHATTDTAIVMASGHDQRGQGQYQAITESLDSRNLSYGTGPTATQQISLNEAISNSQTITNTDFVMTSGHDQTGQGQYQAITESLDTRNLSYGTGLVFQENPVYVIEEIQ